VTLRAEVLSALRASGSPVSGEDLARRFGVSRAAIAKHVAALRGEGYEIEAAAGSGYIWRAAPELALPAEVAALVRDPMWTRFEGGASTGSTNEDCKRLARAGAAEGTVVVAAHQSGGRGRLGREWESPGGGAYLSALLRPRMAPADLTALPLAVALGVANGLETLGLEPGLKWPNDVLLSGGKVAGVLLETAAEADRIEWVVAGIGVNVKAPENPYPGAAYVARELPGAVPAAVAAAVLDTIARVYRSFARGGFAALAAEYQARSVLAGADVTVSDAGGSVRAAGRVGGIDAAGRLLVDTASGEIAVSAGDVTLRGGTAG
jgi:BirA family biotin operon repressor/biotin-[acetyl-CoA-carboxylase] ligase